MTSEKLQAEAELRYPYLGGSKLSEWHDDQIVDLERAAHVVCAEKYTAIIEGLKQKHEERILILALDMQKKDQEIERLREGLHLISGRAELGIQDMTEATGCLVRIKQYASDALKTPTP